MPRKTSSPNHPSRTGKFGRRAGFGRGKGTPNKVTGEARELFQAFVDRRAADIDRLWNEVANGRWIKQGKRNVFVQADPAQALNILGRMAEYVLPKLQRTEVTGPGGGPIQHEDTRDRNLSAIEALSARLPGAALGAPAVPAETAVPGPDDGGGGS